jgi:hypothetical protein
LIQIPKRNDKRRGCFASLPAIGRDECKNQGRDLSENCQRPAALKQQPLHRWIDSLPTKDNEGWLGGARSKE